MSKEPIFEVSKKSAIPIIEPGGKKSYMKFKKGDIVSIKKIKFSFIEPATILTIIVALMVLAVGSFAFAITWSEISSSDAVQVSGSECQAVANPALQQNVTIPDGATITRVYETLNTGSTQNIDAGNYTQVGTTVTINVTG